MRIQKLRAALWPAAAFVIVGLGISALGPSRVPRERVIQTKEAGNV